MPVINLALAGQSYQARSLAVAAQQTVNLYPELIQDPQERAKGNAALFGCPGRNLAKSLITIDSAATPIRGLWSGGGRLFVAAGTKYMELNSNYNLVGSVQTIADDATHTTVQFFPNGRQLFVVSAGLAYCDNGAGPVQITFPALSGVVTRVGTGVTWVSGDTFDIGLTGQVVTINGSPFTVAYVQSALYMTLTTGIGTDTSVAYSGTPVLTATTGAFLDGYFLVNRPNSNQFNWSALNDGTSWDPLDFGVKESNPDWIRGLTVNDEQLYLWGTDTFEVWQNTGQGIGGTPFERIDGGSQRYGSISPWGPIGGDGQLFTLGGSPEGATSAYVLVGFTPKRISTHAEEQIWNTLGFGLNAVSYFYREEGHSFWVINFGTQTWAYDTTTGAWHQRYAWNGSAFTPYPTRYHTFLPEWGSAGRHITGGTLNGSIYESSVNFYSDAGSDIAWLRAVPYIYENGGNRVYFGRQTLEMETGTVASGAAPVVTRDYSDDRGQTFVNPQTAAIGVHADYSLRVYWPLAGSSRNRVFRYQGAGQSKVALVNVQAEVEYGAN